MHRCWLLSCASRKKKKRRNEMSTELVLSVSNRRNGMLLARKIIIRGPVAWQEKE